jgi:predicted TIM-barrel fold metal-dependent hydrolase
MESAGIDWRILSLSSPGIYQWPQREQPRMARRINTFISDYTRRHPDRFLGLASLPLSDPQGSIDELIFALDELGLVGAAMPSHANGLPLNHPSL